MQIHCLDPHGINKFEREANLRLEQVLPNTWKGYSSLEVVSRQNGQFECDLILVTNDRLIVVELKDYGGELKSVNKRWVTQFGDYQEERTHGVFQASRAAKKLSTKIKDKLQKKLKMVPWVSYCVVLCGEATKDKLPDDEKEFVFSLEEFTKISSGKVYDSYFEKLPWRNTPQCKEDRPNQYLFIWDKFFANNSADFRPKSFSINGYVVTGRALFKQKDNIYSEFLSQKKDDSNYKSLMRKWDFLAPSIASKGLTPEDRKLIAHRESKVLGYIDSKDDDLKQIHLGLLYSPSSITTDFVELYDWPSNKHRLVDFMAKNRHKLNFSSRLDLVQVFLSQLARLHDIEVAHRDIGSHSVWLALPSRVTFSNFLTASYPDPNKDTVHSVREIIKNGQVETPEDLYGDADGTPFTRDVYLATAVAHYIIFDQWPSVSEDGVYEWRAINFNDYNGALDNWFETGLDIEAKNRFKNLKIALDSFNEVVNRDKKQDSGSLRLLSDFYTTKNPYHMSEYDPKPVGSPKGRSSLYRSSDGKYGIKVWSGVNEVTYNHTINYQLLFFLNRAQNLINANLTCISKIAEFGYNPNFFSMFLVYEWQDGFTWDEWLDISSQEETQNLVKLLLESAALLHRNNLIHGDIHPKNIIVVKEDGTWKPVFIDFLDFTFDGAKPYNPGYVPNNHQSLSMEAKDRYAVTKMILEAAELKGLIHLADYCRNQIEQLEIPEGDYSRFIDNFEEIVSPQPPKLVPVFEISGKSFKIDNDKEIESDDGKYYANIKISKDQYGFVVKAIIVGPYNKIELHIDLETKKIIKLFLLSIGHDQFIRNQKLPDAALEGRILLKKSNANEASDFIEYLLDLDTVKYKVEQAIQDNLSLNQGGVYGAQSEKITIQPIQKVWRALVDTERETLPKALVISGPKHLTKDEAMFHYSIENKQIDFNLNNEKVNIKIEINGELRDVGRVTDIGNDVIKFRPRGKLSLKVGDVIILEGSLEAASFAKREKAIEVLINRLGVIPNLPDYFDPNLDIVAKKCFDEPSDSELDEYVVTDESGIVQFSLNQAQKDAFKKLYSLGPVGLLQGPPGTGKTAFIGSFIHYAIEHGASRVLLVSQSHEAVNNAAEKVRALFSKKGKAISIVRLGDETNVSQQLLDVQEVVLQDHYREIFRASYKQRIIAVSRSLALPDDFVVKAVHFEQSFGKDIDSLISNMKYNEQNISDTGTIQRQDIRDKLKAQEKNIKQKLSERAESEFGFTFPIRNLPLSEIREYFFEELGKHNKIYSPDKLMKFKNILYIASEWLSVLSSRKAQFQNFLAKTRTLVCGTCVGIGRNHYGLEENVYDLVVIDEAARATASEMAIALRVGRKILLVGDHKQLPPQLEEEHLKAAQKRLLGIDINELARSDFERSFHSPYGKQVGQTLSIQYRMSSPIGNLVSHCFYNDKLQSGKIVSNTIPSQTPPNPKATVSWLDTSTAGIKAFESKLKGKDVNSHSFVNEYEAKVILNLIQTIVDEPYFQNTYVENDEPAIGVICMYAEQRRLLINQMNSLDWARPLLDKRLVKVDTVDSYQGKENPYIIVSLVRNNQSLKQGFLSSENRANVAISRAKERLYIIGSQSMWNSQNIDSAFGRILSYIKERSKVDTSYEVVEV